MATGSTKPQGTRKIPEMQSLSSSERESSNIVESPSGTSQEVSYNIAILSTGSPSSSSPNPVSPEFSTESQLTFGSGCSQIGDRFYVWCDCFRCGKHKVRWILFAVAVICFIVNYSFTEGNPVFWEVLYSCAVVTYCSFFSCIERGKFSKSFWIKYPKRNRRGCGPSLETLRQESKQDVSSGSQNDVPEQPQVVKVDLDFEAGTSTSEV